MEKYIGKHVTYLGAVREIVGYSKRSDGSDRLIIDASEIEGWANSGPNDVIFKECKLYLYVGIRNLID